MPATATVDLLNRLRRAVAPRTRARRLLWRLRALLLREPAPERLRVRVVARHPHDPTAFTQGLAWSDGWLYESTGGYGCSTVRRVDLATGRVAAQSPLPAHLFGEGLARVGDHLIQLTWRERVALVWDADSLRLVDQLPYDREGWGLCPDGASLVSTDGSDVLAFRDPDRLLVRRTATVSDRGWPVRRLNDLEVTPAGIVANVWGAEHLVRVDSARGRVTGVVDARGLLSPEERAAAGVLNGLAHDPATGRLLLTGKLWPALFEVEVVAGG